MFSRFNPETFLISLVALVIAIAIHEFAHAITADSLGDRTARHQGRITLNPLAHFDPLGFFMLVLLAAGAFGFAWGRPVPVNPYALRGGRRGMALVAFAGPLSNLMQAAVAVAVLRLVAGTGIGDQSLLVALNLYIRYNILLAAFNMLPVPPLDGYNVLMGLVSNFWVQRLEPLRQMGVGILLLLVFVGGAVIYPYTVMPMYNFFASIVGYTA